MPKAQSDETLLYKRIGEELRAIRGELTQTQLADLIESEQGTISDYEKARSRVPLHVVARIEDACDVNRGTVFRRVGLVEDSVEAAIEGAPGLTEFGRRSVASYYRFARDELQDGF